MPLIPQEMVDKLNRIPLVRVMEHNGYVASYRTENAIFYTCPFHGDKDPSFKIDIHSPREKTHGASSLPGFNCFGCGIGGYGALMLQAALMGKELGKDFRMVAEELYKAAAAGEGLDVSNPAVDALAKIDNAVIAGDHKNGFFHRARKTEPQDEFSFTPKDGFSHNDLRALGCQIQQVFRPNWRNGGRMDAVMEDGNPVWKYSFGEGFYNHEKAACNFDPSLLTERFGLYPVSEFISEKREKDGIEESYRVVSTDTYPIFVFRYKDENGWWCRKYEPYFKTTEKSPQNYKFTWWYEGGVRRDEEMSKYMYGDLDVMRAMYGTGKVESSDKQHPTMEVTELENGNRNRRTKFKRLVICSGPRDAINVYFHSDAHVCFPHSETVEIPPRTISRLREIANEIFILYDIDETGRKRANRLAMRFLDLKVVYLPKDLAKLTSSRTGNPCKDAEEYFNYYPSQLKNVRHFYGSDINEHFANMLCDAKPMKFWKEQKVTRRRGKEDEYEESKFTLRINNMNQFLSASGMSMYSMGAKDTYANVGEDKIVDIMEEKEAFLCAKQVLKDYLSNNRFYNSEGLADTISDTRKLSLGTLQEITELNLDFRSWGEDFDYLFFRNGAVQVTKDSISRIPYSRMPYHTNREAILDVDFTPVNMKQYFEILPNEELAAMEAEYMTRKREAQTKDEKKRIQEEWNAYRRLNLFKLKLHKPMEEMPPVIQYIYDMGRIFWRDEEAGLALTPEKKQFHDMHFINKIVGLGYMLSRYRTDTRQQMVALTDYRQNGTKASGGTGKTMFTSLLPLVRKGLDEIPGKQFRKDPDKFALNFSDFTLTVHSYVGIDDLSADLEGGDFYNLVKRLQVRSYYHNMVLIPSEESPKIIITNNQSLDVSSSSTYRRMWPMYACDYYHGVTYEGDEEYSPKIKFGYDIIKGLDEEERNFNRNLLAYALQCYFWYLTTGEEGAIHPPMDGEAKLKMLASSCKLNSFTDWFAGYFSESCPWHFERPIHIDELAISYLEHRDALKERKEPVTKKAVEALLPNLKTEIMRFCAGMNITINPDIVYPGDYDRGRGVVRKPAWKTLFDSSGRIREPRERERTNGRCWYFYRKGNEPRTKEQILEAPKEDEEMKMMNED